MSNASDVSIRISVRVDALLVDCRMDGVANGGVGNVFCDGSRFDVAVFDIRSEESCRGCYVGCEEGR